MRRRLISVAVLVTAPAACLGPDGGGERGAVDSTRSGAEGPRAVAPLPSVRSGPLRVGDLVVAEPVTGDRTALYFTVENGGTEADTLLAVETEWARASLHRTSTSEGVMRMRPVGRVPVSAGASVRFRPGGLHVMLEALTRSLAPGDTVPLRLMFEREGSVEAHGRVVAYAELEAVLPAAPGGDAEARRDGGGGS